MHGPFGEGTSHVGRAGLEPGNEVGLTTRVDEDIGVRRCRVGHAIGQRRELLERGTSARDLERHQFRRCGERERGDAGDGAQVIAHQLRTPEPLARQRSGGRAGVAVLGGGDGRKLGE